MVSRIFEWKMDKPLDLPTGTAIKSDPFSVGVNNISIWQMSFYPSGSMQSPKEYTAVYLKMIGGSSVKSSSKIALFIKDEIITAQMLHDCVSKESDEYKLDMFARIMHISYPLLIRCELTVSDEKEILPSMKRVDDSNRVPTDIQYLFSDQKKTDVFIITRDQMKFGARKAELAAQSEVFSSMFRSDASKNLEGKFVFIDMDGNDAREFLKFIYYGIVGQWSLSLYMTLYAASDKYEIHNLKYKCCLYIRQNMNFEAAANILVLADTYKDKILKEASLHFISRNAKLVLQSRGWEKMVHSQQHLVDELILYMADNLQRDDHMQVYKHKY